MFAAAASVGCTIVISALVWNSTVRPDRNPRGTDERLLMRSSSPSRSLLRAAAWVYVGPLIAIGGLALFVLGLGVLVLAIQLVAAMLKNVSI